ncbi:hypothetical protein, partial [Mycobacterium tuberculosis]
ARSSLLANSGHPAPSGRSPRMRRGTGFLRVPLARRPVASGEFRAGSAMVRVRRRLNSGEPTWPRD